MQKGEGTYKTQFHTSPYVHVYLFTKTIKQYHTQETNQTHELIKHKT